MQTALSAMVSMVRAFVGLDGRETSATPRAQPAPTARDVERRVTVQMELAVTDFQVRIR